MLELRLIGVHDDGENLVLESADGTRFLLPIDANLRTSIRTSIGEPDAFVNVLHGTQTTFQGTVKAR